VAPKAEARAEADRLMAAFRAAGAVPVEADILQPAEVLLDLYGEDIRARAYVTNDPIRGEMMLRPDFTVPVVQMHMAGGADPARYCYMGEVFRKQEHLTERKSEYFQAGYEVFARENPESADAERLRAFCRAPCPPWPPRRHRRYRHPDGGGPGAEHAGKPQGSASAPHLAAGPLHPAP